MSELGRNVTSGKAPDGKVVRLAQGNYEQVTVYGDDPVEVASRFVEAGARIRLGAPVGLVEVMKTFIQSLPG